MQNALPVLHNALGLSGLSHANELEMMEPSQVDGNLSLAWPWNICDSSNIIDAAKVETRDRWGAKSKDGGWDRAMLVCNNVAVQDFYWLSTANVINQEMKDDVSVVH